MQLLLSPAHKAGDMKQKLKEAAATDTVSDSL